MRNWLAFIVFAAIFAAIMALGSNASSESGGDTPGGGGGGGGGSTPVVTEAPSYFVYIAWSFFGVLMLLTVISIIFSIIDAREVFRERRQIERELRPGSKENQTVEELARKIGLESRPMITSEEGVKQIADELVRQQINQLSRRADGTDQPVFRGQMEGDAPYDYQMRTEQEAAALPSVPRTRKQKIFDGLGMAWSGAKAAGRGAGRAVEAVAGDGADTRAPVGLESMTAAERRRNREAIDREAAAVDEEWQEADADGEIEV